LEDLLQSYKKLLADVRRDSLALPS
jgi:hypothetical protein